MVCKSILQLFALFTYLSLTNGGTHFTPMDQEVILEQSNSYYMQCVIMPGQTARIIGIRNVSTGQIETRKKISKGGEYQCVGRFNKHNLFFVSNIVTIIPWKIDFGNLKTTQPVLEASGTKSNWNVFKCPPISSVPDANIYWYIDGKEFEPTKDLFEINNKLIWLNLNSNVQQQHSVYCKVTHSLMQVSQNSANYTFLTLRGETVGAPFEFVEKPSNYSCSNIDYGNIRFSCAASAQKTNDLTYSWLCDGKDCNSVQEYYGGRSIFYVGQCKNMEVRCIVNYKGKTISANSFLKHTVLYPPVIKIEDSADIIYHNQDVKIRCKTIADPPPTISWYKNGTLIEDEQDELLILTNVDDSTTSSYQCIMENVASAASSDVLIINITSQEPIWLPSKTTTRVIKDKGTTLSCSFQGSPLPKISWKDPFDKNLCEDRKNYRCETTKIDSFSVVSKLTIEFADPSIEGALQCIAQNKFKTVYQNYELIVYNETQIVQKPHDVEGAVGEISEMRCVVDSDKRIPYNITWKFKNNNFEEIIIENDLRFQLYDHNSTLKISVTHALAGKYTCEVRSSYGSQKVTAVLTSIDIPSQVIIIEAKAVSSRSAQVSIQPIINGNTPLTEIVFLRNDGDDEYVDFATFTENLASSTLLLDTLHPNTKYKLQLVAVNKLGRSEPSEAFEIVTAEDVPSDAPSEFEVIPSSVSIEVNWKRIPFDSRNGIIIGYQVSCYVINRPSGARQHTTNPNVFSYTFKELAPFRRYTVAISGKTKIGIGKRVSKTVKTLEGRPEIPKNFSVSANSPRSAILNIAINDVYLIKGNFKFVIVQLKNDTGTYVEKFQVKNYKPNKINLSFQLKNLAPACDYKIRTAIENSLHRSEWSSVIPLQTPEDAPGKIEVVIRDVTEKSVLIKWHPPVEANGKIIGYNLKFKEFGSDTETFMNLSSTMQQKSLNTQPLHKYHISMNAVTNAGNGPWTNCSFWSKKDLRIPGPPTNIDVVVLSSTSIKIKLSEGDKGGTNLKSYLVEGFVGTRNIWEEIAVIPYPNTTQIVLKSLKPATNYVFRLAASTVMGRSAFTEATETVTTLESTPSSAPILVHTYPTSPTSIAVQWRPLTNNTNGEITGYVIKASQWNGLDKRFHRLPRSNSTYTTIEGLIPYSTYEICIAASTKIGEGPFSSPLHTVTFESVPEMAPRNVEVEHAEDGVVKVSWDPLKKSDRYGHLVGYQIKIYSETAVENVMAPPNVSHWFLKDLLVNAIYKLSMCGVTRMGAGNCSEVQKFSTRTKVPPFPTNVWVQTPPGNDASCLRTIHWQPPRHLVEDRLYFNVKITKGKAKDLHNIANDILSNSHSTKLQCQKRYQVHLVSCYEKGKKCGDPYTFTLTTRQVDENRPNIPQMILKTEIKNSKLSIHLPPPSSALVRNRTVVVSHRKNGEAKWIKSEFITTGNLIVSQTIPSCHQYKVFYYSKNDFGQSNDSHYNGISVMPSNIASYKLKSHQISAERRGKSEASVSVDISSLLCKIETILVFWRKMEFSNSSVPFESITFDPQKKNKTITLGQLQSDSVYEIHVKLKSEHNTGPMSEPVYLQVYNGVPEVPPSDVQKENVGVTFASFSWRFPHHENVKGFSLFYHKVLSNDYSGMKELYVASNRTPIWATIEGLEGASNYTFQVAAFNNAGDGIRTDPIYFFTDIGYPDTVTHLNGIMMTETSVLLTWDEPEITNGEITGYVIEYSPKTVFEITGDRENEAEHQMLSAKFKIRTSQILVENLLNLVQYIFKVSACTKTGCGSYKEITEMIGTKDEGAPSKPKNLRASISSTSITTTWIAPRDADVFYFYKRRIGQPNYELVAKLPYGTSSYVYNFDDSEIGQKIPSFAVQAENKYGRSLMSTFAFTGHVMRASFYNESWFHVIIVTTVVFVCFLLTLVLCIRGKKKPIRKQKDEIMNHGGGMISLTDNPMSCQLPPADDSTPSDQFIRKSSIGGSHNHYKTHCDTMKKQREASLDEHDDKHPDGYSDDGVPSSASNTYSEECDAQKVDFPNSNHDKTFSFGQGRPDRYNYGSNSINRNATPHNQRATPVTFVSDSLHRNQTFTPPRRTGYSSFA